jgi:hypothetical protein
MAELLKLLIPRISTRLLAHELVRNKTTGAPHEYVYQRELFSLLSWAFTRDIGGDNPRVFPEAKELGGRRRIGLVAFNRGVYAIELGANMDQSKYDEHYERTCRYVEFLRKAYPDKHVAAVLVNFTTNDEQLGYFPTNAQPGTISLLNVFVWLDDPSKNVYYVHEPDAAAIANDSATSDGGLGAVAQRLARLSVTEGKIGTSRSTPLKAKVTGAQWCLVVLG